MKYQFLLFQDQGKYNNAADAQITHNDKLLHICLKKYQKNFLERSLNVLTCTTGVNVLLIRASHLLTNYFFFLQESPNIDCLFLFLHIDLLFLIPITLHDLQIPAKTYQRASIPFSINTNAWFCYQSLVFVFCISYYTK